MHAYQCVQSFRLSTQCLELLTCSQMLIMRLHTGAVRTPQESALKADSKRKIACRTGELNLCQYCVCVWGGGGGGRGLFVFPYGALCGLFWWDCALRVYRILYLG